MPYKNHSQELSPDELLREHQFDPAEPPMNCENCMFYEERPYGYVCGILEAEFTTSELDAMSDEEKKNKFSKKADDYCHDHELWED